MEQMKRHFEDFPIPLKDSRKHLRLDHVGRPWLQKEPEAILRRLRVPKEERKAFLKALGFF